MSATERPVLFACEGDMLLGILSEPQTPGDIAVVIVVGGPQYRAGSHRQFVLLARRLAAEGYPVLRFDYRGIGDSEGDPRSFEQVSRDINAAIGAVQRQLPAVRRVALWGLCDGGSAALLYLHDVSDARVAGLCLLNPWVRSAASLARTQVKHYYRQRLLQGAFWRKLFSGGVAKAALADLLGNLRAAGRQTARANTRQSFQDRMAAAWRQHARPILLLLSGNDFTAKEFLEFTRSDKAWAGAFEHPNLTRHMLAGADHTFSGLDHWREVEDLTCAWLRSLRASHLSPAMEPA